MKPIQDSKRNFPVVFVITAAIIAAVCFTACKSSDKPTRIIPIYSEISCTKTEAVDLYCKYSEELDEVAEILLASDTFRQSAIVGCEYVYIGNTDKKEYFSKGDWNKIADLFENVRMNKIVRSWQGGENIIIISFWPKYVNGDWFTASLYYYENPEIVETYRSLFSLDELEYLNGYWYINEQFRKG